MQDKSPLVAPRHHRRCAGAWRRAAHPPRLGAAGARRLAAARRALREGQARGRGHDLGARLAVGAVDPGRVRQALPGVKVTWLGDQQASSRLIAEQRAGRHATDVWTFSLGGTLEVQKRGLLEKYDWRQFGAQDRDIFWDGEAVCNHNFVYAPLYMKAKLTKEQVPDKWDGMLDPKWTDKMVSGNFLLPRLGGYLAIEWGLERTEKWIKTLIDQRKLMITTADVSTFFKSGERQLAVAESVSGAS